MQNEFSIRENDAEQRLDRFLRKKFPQIPLGSLQRLIREKKIGLFRNGKREKFSRGTMLEKGDQVRIFFPIESFGEKVEKPKIDMRATLHNPFFKDVNIVFEDEHILVVEKPAGIPVHPGTNAPWEKSLVGFISAYVKKKTDDTWEPKLAHRIDKNTSGLVILAKTAQSLRLLTKMFREGTIHKEYLALVKGKFLEKSGSICEKLIRTEGSGKSNKIETSQEYGAKESITHFEVESFFEKEEVSLLKVFLETGRMHQIRVHFASKGHPLAGDDAYGDFAWNKIFQKKYALKRQFLHAARLEFSHPITKKKCTFFSSLPKDLTFCMSTLS
jgi:23S rRNA pseudouridine955/2504/2580 synthase